MEPLTITTERADDLPLLAAQLERMGVAAVLDAHFPTHGGWAGLSLGGTAAVWLAHLLSRADHRLSHVQPWAAQRLETLRGSFAYLGRPVRALDVADDRLAAVLAALSDDARWAACEAALAGRLVRAYDLLAAGDGVAGAAPVVRLDATTASGYWAVTADGLFQFGHSKDHRPDLPQLKVMLAALDPLGLPLATDVVSGERADDRLYLPAVARVQQGVGRTGLLYVGDCKMASLETRAGVAAGDDYYLCPLPAGQVPATALDGWLAPVQRGEQALETVWRQRADGEVVAIAEGYEWTEERTATVGGAVLMWPERRLLVRSLSHARAAETALRARVAKARAALATLAERVGAAPRRGRPSANANADPRQAASAVLSQHQVADVLRVTWTERHHERTVLAPGGRLATVCDPTAPRISTFTVTLDEAALAAAVARLGWRVYVTNHPATLLPLAQAVLAYRDEYLVERSLGRLKGQPLSLTPMYLSRDDHATGLVRLLSLGLRVLTLLEGSVRRALATPDAAPLAGLYPGNPTRTTRRPSAERLLAAFENLTLTIVRTVGTTLRHLPPLSPLQQRILTLLGCPDDTYARLTAVPRELPP